MLQMIMIITAVIANHYVHACSSVCYILAETFLKDAQVAISDISPPVEYGRNLDHPEYRACGQYKGIPLATATTLTCGSSAIGRYIYVYHTRRNYLAICEFEAYGYREYLIWHF